MEEMTFACLYAAIAREDSLILHCEVNLPCSSLTLHPSPSDYGKKRETTSPAEAIAEMLGHNCIRSCNRCQSYCGYQQNKFWIRNFPITCQLPPPSKWCCWFAQHLVALANTKTHLKHGQVKHESIQPWNSELGLQIQSGNSCPTDS